MKKTNVFMKMGDGLAELLNTRVLASVSVTAFIFMILRLFFPIEPLFLLVVLIGIVLIWLNMRHQMELLVSFLICGSMLFGICISNGKINSNKALENLLDGQFARIEGVVVTVPSENSYNTKFYMECDKIQSHKGTYDDKIKVYVKADKNDKIEYGDRIVINCTLVSAQNADARFSKTYLSKGAPVVAENIQILKKSKLSFREGPIIAIRNYILGIADKLLNYDAKELFKALVAGDQSGFSEEFQSNMAASGLSHVASVSGLHVSVLGIAVYNLIRKKNRNFAVVSSLAVVFLFTLVAGAMPAAVRSAIMFSSFMAAKLFLMENDSFTALAIAALVQGIINPYVIFDWGFILSFLSVLGIQLFYQTLKAKLRFMPDILSESTAVTISAQIMTIPATASMFGTFPIYSILSNVVISSVFLWILCFCFIFVFIASIPYVSHFAAIICTFLLDVVVVVAKFFADMPYSTLLMDSFDFTEYMVYYTFVFLFLFRKKLSVYFMIITALVFSIILALT